MAKRDDQSTRRHYEFWTERLGHVRLGNATADMIVAARDHLLTTESRRGKPLAPATVKLYIESLSAVFKTCRKEWRWATYNPCSDVTRPKLPKGRVRFLSDSERTALLDACQKSTEPRLYPFVLLAISTGARAGELTELLWRDVDLERGTASLRKTKNGEMRALPIKGQGACRDKGDARGGHRPGHARLRRAARTNLRLSGLFHQSAGRRGNH